MQAAGGSIDESQTKWVVVIEAVTPIDGWSLYRVLQVLADVHPAGLHSRDRFAVQMEIDAGGQAEALFVALARCRSALAATGQPVAEFVRSEVLSLEEFECDCRLACGDASTTSGRASASAAVGLMRHENGNVWLKKAWRTFR